MPVTAGKRTTAKYAATNGISVLLRKAPVAAFPEQSRPMLATLIDKPFDSGDWLYEVKWDGYRAMAFLGKNRLKLISRNNKSLAERFYPISRALQTLRLNAVLDGEIIVPDKQGVSHFGQLQNWRSEADGTLLYYVFDILWYEGRDLTQLSLLERRKILESVLPDDDTIRLSQAFKTSGVDFFKAAKQAGLEGIIAKNTYSTYEAGERSRQWLKIKAHRRQEMVIGGFTRNEDTPKPFSSLLLGVFDKGRLNYMGKVGTGFNLAMQAEMMKQFKKLRIKHSPFSEIPDVNKPSRFRPDPPHATVTWLKPLLVCEVSYTELTSDGIMRHPSFEGMRIDKNARDVVPEKEKKTVQTVKTVNNMTSKSIIVPAKNTGRSSLLNPSDDRQVRVVKGHEMTFTNLGKIFWPKEKYTKRDVLNYYYQAAPYIMPYLKNRPQSMYRHPNGIEGKSFYYKDITGNAPEWIKRYRYRSEADNRDRQYLVATDEASLLYMANLGCIEMNPWSSTADREDYPDWCIIDLDPGDNTFSQVIQAALVTKDVLDGFAVPSYPKTSGSTGMHIYIPLGAKYTYGQSKEFARVVARMVHEELPRFTTIERLVKERGGKMYIDFLQNRPQATISAPYSLRPKPGAPVSMPLHWEEVKKGLKMTDFNIRNAPDRMREMGDIFKPVLGKGINLKKIAGILS